MAAVPHLDQVAWTGQPDKAGLTTAASPSLDPLPVLLTLSALPTPARFRPLGPPMSDSPRKAS
jgi:hypothetical protein